MERGGPQGKEFKRGSGQLSTVPASGAPRESVSSMTQSLSVPGARAGPGAARPRPSGDAMGHLKARAFASFQSTELQPVCFRDVGTLGHASCPLLCIPWFGPVLSFSAGYSRPCRLRSLTGIVFPSMDVVFPHYRGVCSGSGTLVHTPNGLHRRLIKNPRATQGLVIQPREAAELGEQTA